jgi:prevent-host-death family protein
MRKMIGLSGGVATPSAIAKKSDENGEQRQRVALILMLLDPQDFLYGRISHYGHRGFRVNKKKELDAWTVAAAKARLSEVIERAQAEPQTITRRGKPSVVVVSIEEWGRKANRKGTLAEFLLASPLRGAELDLGRKFDQPRDLGL